MAGPDLGGSQVDFSSNFLNLVARNRSLGWKSSGVDGGLRRMGASFGKRSPWFRTVFVLRSPTAGGVRALKPAEPLLPKTPVLVAGVFWEESSRLSRGEDNEETLESRRLAAGPLSQATKAGRWWI